jgi:hypothetical protein
MATLISNASKLTGAATFAAAGGALALTLIRE